MTREKFDLLEANAWDNSASTASLVKEPKTSYAWRKIIIAGVVVALVLACVLALVFGLREQQSGSQSPDKQTGGEQMSTTSTVKPTVKQTTTPEKETWMSKSCISKQTPVKCPWAKGRSKYPLLVFDLDGFSADYINRKVTPVIQRLIDCGVHTPELRPVYPSLTFPNDQSIVTGLYPESHGIVDNSMYDEEIDEEFKIGTQSKEKPEWWGGEPIWVTAKKQGRKSATFIWPMASNVNMSGNVPDIQVLFNPQLTPEQAVDKAFEWLELPEEERPDFITLFSSEPSKTGRSKGPDSIEVTKKLQQLDNVILKLFEGLHERELDQCVNIMLIADHGMTSTSCERKEYLECYTDVDDMLIFDGTVGRISTAYRRDSDKKIVRSIDAPSPSRVASDLECRSDHYKVFQRGSVPVRFHYGYNARIGDVIIDIEDGWLVYQKQRTSCPKGNHGYDNLDKAMQALFVGYGPSFKESVQSAPFENIELYNLMCDLLGITPAPNNGTAGSLHHLLKNPPVLQKFTAATTVEKCPVVTGGWTGLQQCNCTSADQQTFISKTTIIPENAQLRLEVPALHSTDDMCLLHQQNYSTGFSHTLHMPRWVATTLTAQQMTPSMSDSVCVVPDNRLNVDDRTAVRDVLPVDNNITVGNLLPGNYFGESCGSIALSSTLVPMYSGFRTGIWQYLWEMAHSYAGTAVLVSVTVGPVFDHNHDGKVDKNQNLTRYVDSSNTISLPTHFYMIIVKCKHVSETLPCNGNIDTLSFVLPHTQRVPNCLDYKSYLKDNVVRIRDIELLTGLQFLDQFPYYSSLASRLYLGRALWQSAVEARREENRTQNAPKHWIDWTCPSEGGSCPSDYKPVLLISMDGFRADYIKRNVTPNIHKLIKHGVHSPYMRAVYPTYTFPNHYTLATGLYPESHGIIDNKMFDMKMNKSFSIGSPSGYDTRWWGGEPMWLTSQRQGKKSATYFWVGSDVEIQGGRPNYYKNYSNPPFVDRVNDVLEWLSLSPEQRPEFITLYFNEPDYVGHKYGPDDTEHLNPVLKNVDDMMGLLMDGLYKRKLHNCVNIILVADHGMTPRSCDRAVSLNDVIFDDEMANLAFYTGMIGRISNKYSRVGKKYTYHDPPVVEESTILNRLRCLSPHMRTYRKQEQPKRKHYVNNHRIDDIVLDIDNEWIISRTRNPKSGCSGASHGEDNIYASEGALFVAHGPAFKQGVEVEPFENIELYNLMADVLDITPAPNNGTKGSLYHLLRNPPKESDEPVINYKQCRQSSSNIQNVATQFCNCSSMTEVSSAPYIDLPTLSMTPTSPLCKVAYGHQTSVYSSQFGLPRWTAVYLNSSKNSVSPENPGCVVPDPSLPTADRTRYQQYKNPSLGVTAASLVTAMSSECGTVSLSSSLVPMYKGFKEGVWKYAWTLVDSYLSQYGELQVTAGPIWDYDYDGLYEGVGNKTRFVDDANHIILPTHFFLVLSKCHSHGDKFPCMGKMDLLPLILPHTPSIPTCESHDHYIFENVARLRDIELLTGLKFFSNMSLILSAPLRTFLPTALWDSPVLKPTVSETGSWMNHSCETEPEEQCSSDYKPVLLISLDGFRADYLVKYNVTPIIKQMSNCGVHVPFMRSVYPTKTFPNHYTIVTGLYPESHGIIDNNMYDPDLHQKFSLSLDTKQDPRWWLGEPVWQTVKNAGKKTAAFFWPGTDVKDNSPNYFRRYLKGQVKYHDRVDIILYWLTLPADRRPDFLTLYVDEPDHQAHIDGPEAESVLEKLQEVDSLMGYLMDGLYRRNLHNCVNIILLADHGMADKNCRRMVSLRTYLSSSELGKVYVYDGPFGRISNKYTFGSKNNDPLPAPLVSKETLLNRLQCKSSHLHVYDKTQLPVRHHYVNNIRIDDIILDVDERWLVSRTGSINSFCRGGDHGYDNLYQSMGALFVAHGPAFKQNYTTETFDNIELYNLMTSVLDVPAAPNNGTAGALNHLLRNPPVLEDTRQQPHYQNCSGTDGTGSDTISSIKQSVCNCTVMEQIPDMAPVQLPAFSVSSSTCTIHRDPVVSVYSQDFNMPLWAAVTISQMKANMTVYSEEPLCVIPDPKLAPGDRDMYTRYRQAGRGITVASLVPGLNDSCSSAQTSSLVVPMYDGFRTGIWRSLWQLISEYADRNGTLSVVVGPVFDYNSDSRYEGVLENLTRYVDSDETVPIPTHFFVVVYRCQNGNSPPCVDQLDLLSFILPHQEESPNCLDKYKQLHENVARVRDIELITGLEFFTDIPVVEASRLVTFLPTELWDAPGISDDESGPEWKDLPCPGTVNNTCSSDYKPLLVVALDGFRADYLSRGITPVLQRLIDCGSHSPYMRPVYPTKTFPNMYTMITGLYPESHGIVDNTMYDFSIGKKFRLSGQNKNDPRWWGGEPLWITAKRQGKRTASFFWVGSDMEIAGSYPDVYRTYDGSIPYTDRIETVVSWLSLPADERPDFVSLYFDEPDSIGHTGGPTAKEVDQTVAMMDDLIGTLMSLLYRKNLHNCVNIVITADHGMAPTECDRLFLYSNFYSRNDLRTFYVYEGAFSHISNKYKYKSSDVVTEVSSPKFSLSEIADKLRCNNSHVKVMFKEDIPRRLHYANNDRIEGLYLDVPANWTASRYRNTRYCQGGTHGYENGYRTMHALFLAYGPAFKINKTIGGFENIELYNMMADVLGVTPAPNNGTWGSLNPILRSPPNVTRSQGEPYENMTSMDNAEVMVNRSIDCGCPLTSQEATTLVSQVISATLGTSLPFGVPSLQQSLTKVHLLRQPNFVTAYSSDLQQPLWVSYTVTQAMLSTATSSSTNCSLPDPRLTGQSRSSCHIQIDNTTSYTSLISSEFQQSNNLTYKMASSMVPMLKEFYSGIWNEFNSLIKNWTSIYSEVNVLTGPIFDSNHSGYLDESDLIDGSSTIPSDFFAVVSRCGSDAEPLSDCSAPEVLTFIIPHRESYSFNCQNATYYLRDNMGRVRDVELLTGLELFTSLPVQQAIQLRTAITQTLWDSRISS